MLRGIICLVDEVDRCSELHDLGFKGAKEVMQIVKFFYGTSADPLTEDDKVRGLDCPANTEYITMNTEDDKQPEIIIEEINASGPELY